MKVCLVNHKILVDFHVFAAGTFILPSLGLSWIVCQKITGSPSCSKTHLYNEYFSVHVDSLYNASSNVSSTVVSRKYAPPLS